MKKVFLLLALLLWAVPAFSQRYSVGTNVLDYLNFGTLNAEASFAASRHWSFSAGAKYNPFIYTKDEEPVTSRQQVYSLGARWWPWNVYSGWWLGMKGQYQEYNRGGISSPETSEGDRYGGGVAAGFSYMIHPHINIDLGVGVWGGYDVYTTYECPVCGLTVDSGEKWFVLPNDIILSLVYIF